MPMPDGTGESPEHVVGRPQKRVRHELDKDKIVITPYEPEEPAIQGSRLASRVG